MKSLEFGSSRNGDPATEAAVEYYQNIFEPELLQDMVANMKPGDEGYVSYHAATMDDAGRLWLSPLIRVSPEQTDTRQAYIKRDRDGYTIDFRPRVVEGRDRFLDEIVSSEMVDRIINQGRFYGIPLIDVIGEPEQIPGFYCDENGNPPSAGPNGEHYHDFDEVDRFQEVREIYRDLGVAIPRAFEPPFPGPH